MSLFKRFFGKKKQEPAPKPLPPPIAFKVVKTKVSLPIKRMTITLIDIDGGVLIKTHKGCITHPANQVVSLRTGDRPTAYDHPEIKFYDDSGNLYPSLAHVDFSEPLALAPYFEIGRSPYLLDWGTEYIFEIDDGTKHVVPRSRVKEIIISPPFDFGDTDEVTLTKLERL